MSDLGSRWLGTRRASLTFAVAVVATVLLAAALRPGAAQAAPIPQPKDFFGFEIGTTGKLARFEKMKSYYQLIANKSNRVDYQVLGKTVLGNDMPLMTISSPKNLAKLDEIMAMNNRLANPRGLTAEDARELAAKSVPVYYLESGMHSTEVMAWQVMVPIVHRLATEKSAFTKQVLDNAVIVALPAANPDGSHLVGDYFNETDGTDFARTYPDLYHHFTGHDDNRDWLYFTQPESRNRINVFKKYRPVIQHILHQAGAGSPRLWSPPYESPLGENWDTQMMQSSNALGMEVNRGLHAQGKKGAQVDQAYSIFFTADIASVEAFMGAPQFLFELASAKDLAFPYTSKDADPNRPDVPLGNQQRSFDNPAPYDKTTWTLEQMRDYMESAVYLALDDVTEDPEQWLFNSLYKVPRNAIDDPRGPYAYVIPAGQRDTLAEYDLLEIFEFGRVEIDRATAPFEAGGKTYPAGSYILKTRQPLGRWVNQLLDNAKYPDYNRPCSTCPVTMPYSELTDNIGMMMGVQFEGVPAQFSAKTERVTKVAPQPVNLPVAPPATGAYVVPTTSYGVMTLLSRLQKDDVVTFRAAKEFTAGGRTFAPGTVVVEPSSRARTALDAVAKATGMAVFATDQVPQVEGFELKAGTRVGLIRGINNMPGGWLRFLLESQGVDSKVVGADDYDDLGQFDTIVMADGISRERIVEGLDPDRYPERFHWARGVGEEGWAALAKWVQDGGNLVAIGTSSQTAQSLLNLPVQIVRPQPLTIPGSLMRVETAPGVPEGWGLAREWSVWFDNDYGLRVTDTSKGKVVTAYPATGDLLTSGFELGADGLRGLADAATFDVGSGHVTISATDLNFRTWPRAARTLIANALYQGPSKAVPKPSFAAAAAATSG